MQSLYFLTLYIVDDEVTVGRPSWIINEAKNFDIAIAGICLFSLVLQGGVRSASKFLEAT